MFTIASRQNLKRCLASCLLVAATASVTMLPAQEPAVSPAALRQINSRIADTFGKEAVAGPDTSAMLGARHASLVQIFESNPASVRSYALSPAIRASLVRTNPAYAALVEQDVPLTGELTVSVADSLRNHTSQTIYGLHTFTHDYVLSFVTQPANLAALLHQQITVTGLSLPEVIAAESIRVASRSEVQACTASNASVRESIVRVGANAAPPHTGPGVTTTAPTSCSDFGQQSTAVILFNMPSTPAAGGQPASPTPLTLQAPYNTQAYFNTLLNPGSTPNLASYESETSYGATSFATDVYGPFTLSQAYACSPTGPLFTALEVATVSAGIDVSKYNRFIYVLPTTSCAYDGVGTLPCVGATSSIPHEHSNMVYTIPTYYDASSTGTTPGGINYNFLVLAHEMGHDLGLNHSNTLDFGALTLGPIDFVATNPGTVNPGAPAITSYEPSPFPRRSARGDALPAGSTSITGVNTEYGDPFPIMAGVGYTPYNAQHRFDVLGWIPASGEQDVTSSGTFSIAPTEATSGLRSLHVLRDAISDSWVWVEYHQPSSTYTSYAIPFEPTDQTLTTGAELLYSTAMLDAAHSFLLDTTPTSTPNNFDNAILGDGLSWSDPFSLLTITAGSQTANALPVTISYDTPCATVSLSTPVAGSAAGSGSVAINAPANCSWSVSSNTPWVSFTGATTGTGTGSVAYAYTANSTAAQRNGYITAQRQSLPIVQQGTSGTTIVGITNGGVAVAPATFTPVAFNITNPAGPTANTFSISIPSFSALLAVKACNITAEPQPGNPPSNYGIYNTDAGGNDSIIGVAGTLVAGSCTIDLGASTYVINGNNATLTLSMSFPANFFGNHQIDAGPQAYPTASIGYVNVNPPAVPTYSDTTTLMANPTSITTAQSTTLTATVNPTASFGTVLVPTGSVSFNLGASSLGSCMLSNATCSIAVPASQLQTGSNSIVAKYAGNGTYPPSTSTAVSVSVSSNNTTASQITSPAPGSTLTGASATFTWTAGTNVNAWQLNIGSRLGGHDYGGGSPQYNRTLTVSNLPTNGQTIYVRLYSIVNGSFQTPVDYTYTAYQPAIVVSQVTSPASGSTLTGASATFAWTAGTDPNAWQLNVGSGPGRHDYGGGSPQYNRTLTVNNLPTNGQTIYVRLYSIVNGVFQTPVDYTFTAFQPPTVVSQITSPAPGSTIFGSAATFTWTAGTNPNAWQINVGSQPGGYDYGGGWPQTTQSFNTNSLPANGKTIYVRLYSIVNGVFQTPVDYTYTSKPQQAN